jgi:hypothetical protein
LVKNLLRPATNICALPGASLSYTNMSPNMTVARSALKLGFFISSLTVASLGAKLATANISPDAQSRDLGFSAAKLAGGDLSDHTLRTAFNADNSPLFARHDPGMKQPVTFDLLKGYEQGAPLSHWDLTPQAAQAVNQGVPVSSEPILPAKPFAFHGAAADKEAALTCLTQAVYYEAGFEPIQGAQAVAQVVLNRVRHPIFPKSVCGVVYQGADLKTGCQFSFTCDGSLGRAPAPAAWARAHQVAEKALAGFVLKDVGEATHYHTQWILPWWAPTVTKVAQVGTQIFYRWPGSLGMPGAFNGRYAANEHVGKGVQIVPDAQTQTAASDGRVHAILAVAASAPVFEAPVAAKVQTASMEEAMALQTDAPDVKIAAPKSTRSQASLAAPTFVGCMAGTCRH